MPKTLAELQVKYEKAKYEPLPNCVKCHGEGEVWKNATEFFRGNYYPCDCIFFPPEFLFEFRDMARKVFKDLREEFSGNTPVDKIGNDIFDRLDGEK